MKRLKFSRFALEHYVHKTSRSRITILDTTPTTQVIVEFINEMFSKIELVMPGQITMDGKTVAQAFEKNTSESE